MHLTEGKLLPPTHGNFRYIHLLVCLSPICFLYFCMSTSKVHVLIYLLPSSISLPLTTSWQIYPGHRESANAFSSMDRIQREFKVRKEITTSFTQPGRIQVSSSWRQLYVLTGLSKHASVPAHSVFP